MSAEVPAGDDRLVPDDVIPHRHLPPLRYRDLPEPISWKRMVGPSIILAGLSLGSGEFILWPHIVSKVGFVFFWACLVGVVTQFFVNMEIERWTLATGESAITGFCRLSRHWAWLFLLLNILPWAWPGWATGAAKMASWLAFGREPVERAGKLVYVDAYVTPFAIGGLLLVGIVLTSGPVVYNTVEKIQTWLVGTILVLVVTIGVLVIRPDAVRALIAGSVNFGGMPEFAAVPAAGDLTLMTLLGALAFAGAGGTMNLGQSNFIKDKGYGMGRYIGRITSPVTGNEEAIADVGYHFPHTPGNMARWREWWRAANVEHFCSFFLTCVVCLCLMTLIAYSLLYEPDGRPKSGIVAGSGFDFVWNQAQMIAEHPRGGAWLKYAYLVMGIALLLTTELGVMDAVARISTDVVKVNYLRENPRWTQSRLYFWFLWGEILLGTLILASPYVLKLDELKEPMFLLKTSAAMNGGVMFLYSMILLYMNNKILSRSLSMSPLRFTAMVWSCAFFGYFTLQAAKHEVWPLLRELFRMR